MSSPNMSFVIVRYKFKEEDKILIQRFTREAFEDMKNAPMIEFCEIVN